MNECRVFAHGLAGNPADDPEHRRQQMAVLALVGILRLHSDPNRYTRPYSDRGSRECRYRALRKPHFAYVVDGHCAHMRVASTQERTPPLLDSDLRIVRLDE